MGKGSVFGNCGLGLVQEMSLGRTPMDNRSLISGFEDVVGCLGCSGGTGKQDEERTPRIEDRRGVGTEKGDYSWKRVYRCTD